MDEINKKISFDAFDDLILPAKDHNKKENIRGRYTNA